MIRVDDSSVLRSGASILISNDKEGTFAQSLITQSQI